MGLIRLVGDVLGGGWNAVKGATNSVMWKEYFESGDMSDGVLMKRAEKIIVNGSKNTRSDNNLISSGSGIDVQEGQCMIIVDNGKVVEFCAEAGRFTYDASSQPSLFSGQNKGLKAFGKEILSQWSAGGQRFSTQRIYFINLGELIYTPIKWGCGDIAFHHTQVYQATGSMLELDMTLRANGQCTIQITDPMKFFTAIGAQRTGNDSNSVIKVTDEGIMSNLKSGILDHVGTAISTLGYEQQIPYTAIKAKSKELKEYLNREIENEWAGKRGFGIANFSINGSPIPTDENKRELEQMQKSFNMSQNANAMNYDIQKGFSDGFRAAGEKGNFGQATMFGGMMMGGMGGGFGNIQNQPMNNNQYQRPVQPQQPAPQPVQQAPVAPAADTWTCSCGKENDGAFCCMCGSRKPVAGQQEASAASWTCSCGRTNPVDSRFCPSCGSKKPVVRKLVCDKCGWEPKPGEEVRFCPKCGDIFNDADVVEG
jgi:membrane protease subunit (stomatin/prohibitin family)